jgi:hypothetical protein
MIRKLKTGVYAAIISDDVQLVPRAHQEDDCALHILEDYIEPFDMAIAYRKGFPYGRLQKEMSNSLLRLSESGKLADIKQDNMPPKPSCLQSTEFSETNRVNVDRLWGLWIIFASAVGIAAWSSIFHYWILKRRNPEEQLLISARVKPFRDTLTKAMTAPMVPYVVDAFRSASVRSTSRRALSEGSGKGGDARALSPAAAGAGRKAELAEDGSTEEGRSLWKLYSNKLRSPVGPVNSSSRSENVAEPLAVVTESQEECHLTDEVALKLARNSKVDPQQGAEVPPGPGLCRPEVGGGGMARQASTYPPQFLQVKSNFANDSSTLKAGDLNLADAAQRASELELVVHGEHVASADGSAVSPSVTTSHTGEGGAVVTASEYIQRAQQHSAGEVQGVPAAAQPKQGLIAEAVAVLQGCGQEDLSSSDPSSNGMLLPGPPNMATPRRVPSPPFPLTLESSLRSSSVGSASGEQLARLRSELANITAVLGMVDRRVDVLINAMAAHLEDSPGAA